MTAAVAGRPLGGGESPPRRTRRVLVRKRGGAEATRAPAAKSATELLETLRGEDGELMNYLILGDADEFKDQASNGPEEAREGRCGGVTADAAARDTTELAERASARNRTSSSSRRPSRVSPSLSTATRAPPRTWRGTPGRARRSLARSRRA